MRHSSSSHIVNSDGMRTTGVSHFCIFGEVSMGGQSAFGELWVSWVSRHHQGRGVECIAPFFLFSNIDDVRTGGVTHWFIFDELSMIFQSAFGELWVSWAFPHHHRRRVKCKAFVFCCFAYWRYETWRSVSFCIFGEVSMMSRSAFGELWVSWVSKDEGWNA